MANANGTLKPTYPRYSIGGWNAMRMWFCRSGFGPGPSKPGGGTFAWNGLAAVSMRAKKNTAIVNSVIIAHATSGSSRRLRNLLATTAM